MTITKLYAGLPGDSSNSSGGQIRDTVNALVDVVSNLDSGSVSVLSFGAKGDGVTDDTAAIQTALNSAAHTIIFPKTAKYYLTGTLTVPAGKKLVGAGRTIKYTVSSISDLEGTVALVLKPSSDALIELQGPACYFYGINFVGTTDRSKSLFGVSSVESRVIFEYCGAYYFSHGFGKASGYIRNARFMNCHATNNTVGMFNLIDSHVYMCEINANKTDGIQMMAGAGDCAFIGNKVEWNERHNWQFFQSNNSTINGGVCDRSTDHGMRVIQSQLSVNGVMLRRNGRSGGKAHISHENNTSLLVVGCNSSSGRDDDGNGTLAPDYFAIGTGVASGFNLIEACNVTGNVLGVSSGVQSQIFYKNCRGNPDTPMPFILKATTVVAGAVNTTTVSGTFLQSIVPTVAATNKVKVAFLFRNTTSGLIASQEFVVQLARSGGGNGSATVIQKQNQTSTAINETGANLNITFANVATDCTSFDIVCTNTTANSLQIRVQVYQAEQI